MALAAISLALAACTSVAPPASVRSATHTGPIGAYLAQLRGMNEAALAAEAANEMNSIDMREMASFLHIQMVERRRLRESAAAQKQRADQLQERVAQMQQKLDALGEIEKSLSDRSSKGR